MNFRRNILVPLAATAAVLLGAAEQANAQSIHLRPAAAVAAGIVRVGDVATITGLEAGVAERLAQTAITTISRPTTIRAEQVLFAIVTENGSGPLTGQLQVNGPIECAVDIANSATAPTNPSAAPATTANRVMGPAVSEPATAAASPSPDAALDKTSPPPVKAAPTLADILTAQVIEHLGVTCEDVRISFDTASPLLDEPTPHDAHWLCRPLGHQFIGTMQWDTQLVRGTQPIQHLLVQAAVLQRATVIVALDNVRAGQIITNAQIKTDERWLDRKIATLFSKPEQVAGQMALPASGIAVGTALDQRDFRPVPMAATGELVTVYLISGGLMIKDQAKATSSGRLHETILLKSDGAAGMKSTEYQATLIGRDVAFVGGPLDEATEAKLKEQR